MEKDSFDAEGGPIHISFIGHGTLMLEHAGLVVHVDPVSAEADYTALPKADLILVTHEHSDHLDPKAIAAVRKQGTVMVLNPGAQAKLGEGTALANGESTSVLGIRIEALPAYNTTAGRDRYHPKGRDNGYLLTIGGKRIYIAGDTEVIPEMKALRNIDIAFLPMNQPYTMTPQQVAEAARAFRPRILYPYHYSNTNTAELVELLKGEKDIEVRIRKLD